MKILFSPIHYILDSKNSGSEFSWAYEIYKRFTNHKSVAATFIAGGTRDINDINVLDCALFRPEQLNLSFKNIVKFYFRVYADNFKKWQDI